MGTTDDRTPVEKFEDYNPYAEELRQLSVDGEVPSDQLGLLAIAFALDRVRSELHFGLKERSS